jgi:hypothetical protein
MARHQGAKMLRRESSPGDLRQDDNRLSSGYSSTWDASTHTAPAVAVTDWCEQSMLCMTALTGPERS